MTDGQSCHYLYHGAIIRKSLNRLGSYPHDFELTYWHTFERKNLRIVYQIRMMKKDIDYISNPVKKLQELGFTVAKYQHTCENVFTDIILYNDNINPMVRFLLKWQYRFNNFEGLNHETATYDAINNKKEYGSNFF